MVKITKYTMCQIFKVNKKDTKTTSGASIVNFEHISRFILLLILLNLIKLMPVEPDFSTCEKLIVLWTRKICRKYMFSPNIRLQKDKFLWHHFKKISRTLDYFCKKLCLRCLTGFWIRLAYIIWWKHWHSKTAWLTHTVKMFQNK